MYRELEEKKKQREEGAFKDSFMHLVPVVRKQEIPIDSCQ